VFSGVVAPSYHTLLVIVGTVLILMFSLRLNSLFMLLCPLQESIFYGYFFNTRIRPFFFKVYHLTLLLLFLFFITHSSLYFLVTDSTLLFGSVGYLNVLSSNSFSFNVLNCYTLDFCRCATNSIKASSLVQTVLEPLSLSSVSGQSLSVLQSLYYPVSDATYLCDRSVFKLGFVAPLFIFMLVILIAYLFRKKKRKYSY